MMSEIQNRADQGEGQHSEALRRPLTWALVIATCNRREILTECLRLAAEQTQPPTQIVVVDASEDWQLTRDKVIADLASKYLNVRWVYEPANRRSLPFQRNQGAEIASADVVFMIDDDSLMAPDAAEKVMSVYEADAASEVAAVRMARGRLPGTCRLSDDVSSLPRQSPRPRGLISRSVRRLLNAKDIGLPYDPCDPPKNVVPDCVSGLNVVAVPSMVGYAMTVRRDIVLREPFEPILEAYAAGEDSDFGERIKRHGSLLMACDAFVHHLEVGGGRMPVRIVTALGAVNPMVLHRIYSTDPSEACRRFRWILLRRLLIEFLKDAHSHDWKFSRTRGILCAMRYRTKVFAMDIEAVRTWYPGWQQSLCKDAV